jgi:hypothetical protein
MLFGVFTKLDYTSLVMYNKAVGAWDGLVFVRNNMSGGKWLGWRSVLCAVARESAGRVALAVVTGRICTASGVTRGVEGGPSIWVLLGSRVW